MRIRDHRIRGGQKTDARTEWGIFQFRQIDRLFQHDCEGRRHVAQVGRIYSSLRLYRRLLPNLQYISRRLKSCRASWVRASRSTCRAIFAALPFFESTMRPGYLDGTAPILDQFRTIETKAVSFSMMSLIIFYFHPCLHCQAAQQKQLATM